MSLAPDFTTGKLRFALCPPNGACPCTMPEGNLGALHGSIQYKIQDVSIESLRGKEETASLATTGFQFLHRRTPFKAFTSEEDIKRDYFPECIEICQELTGASHVSVFGHSIRHRQLGRDKTHRPVNDVHGDITPNSAINILHEFGPAPEASSSPRQQRFLIVNIWRPISHPALDWPLALCDCRSLDPTKDIIYRQITYDGVKTQGVYVKYNTNQKWNYYRGMSPDEFVIFKTFDSEEETSFVAHAAFDDPATPDGSPPRESIEVRLLLIFE